MSFPIPVLAAALCLGSLTVAQRRTRPAPAVPHSGITSAVRVQAEIEEGVASVQVALTLENRLRREGEYVLAFPLPDGAVADKLELEIDGKMQEGELADANTARAVYMDIVRRRRDPALLEYAGRGLVRLRVFPIPAGGKREVQLRYRQVLPQAGGLWSLAFPTRAFGTGSFSMDVKLRSKHGLRNVYAPTSGWDIVRKGDHEARASFESKQRPSRDPQLFYSLTDSEFGLSLLSYKKKGEPGYFLMLLSPKRDTDTKKELRKSITFVVDVSGSMRGQKIEQAKGALRYFVSKLKPGDEFNIVPFSTEAQPWQPGFAEATKEKLGEAEKFIATLEARGGTNIHDALTSALASKPKDGNVAMLVFLTDGLPSVGIQQPKEILKAVEKSNSANTRIFAFGVGNDVNTYLIDSICEQSRGTRDYVAPDENIEVKTSALFDKIAHPVLSDLEISCEQVQWNRLAPKRLPDLFRGEQLVVAGRYAASGHAAIRLHGRTGDAKQTFTFEASFAADGEGHDFVSSIWAQRRVGFLLDQMRLTGQNPELVNEVKLLANEHGIVTPYSSQLVLEPGMQGDSIGIRRRGRAVPGGGGGGRPGNAGPAGPSTPAPGQPSGGPATGAARPVTSGGFDFEVGRGPATKGKNAVRESKDRKKMRESEKVEESEQSKRIRDKTFVLRGKAWVDTQYDAEKMLAALRSIEAWSEEYVDLLKKQPELAPYLALKGRILLALDSGKALEIYPAGEKPTPKPKAAPEKENEQKEKSKGEEKPESPAETKESKKRG